MRCPFLLRPMSAYTRPMNGLSTRLFAALARPHQTGYTCPSLMTATAVVYALRGFDVSWTPVGFDTKREERVPSCVTYRCHKVARGERYPSHGVELSCLFPDWMIVAEFKLRGLPWRLRSLLTKGSAR